jgi:hypothetical protein
MKPLLRLLPLIALALVSLRAADRPSTSVDARTLAALQAADSARVAAIMAGDRAGLTAIFSDDLYFKHASGKLDTKESYTEALASKRTVYSKYTYQERNFRQLAPGIVQMAGRLLLETRGGLLDLNFLAIWRNENGRWRFLAWQSARLPLPDSPTAKK